MRIAIGNLIFILAALLAGALLVERGIEVLTDPDACFGSCPPVPDTLTGE